ncbi:lytic transglycosylase domain-containing protein [Cognatishimia sp. MH4019]|uniref:lytic transglycosylase domain-containing protein n=1 Tax=Cognatishimia sp. MH4019 TaxID=2854030 RepID=UPI00351CD134
MVLLCASMLTIQSVKQTAAEALIFLKDGSVRKTDGWITHSKRLPDEPVRAPQQSTPVPKRDILDSIAQTAQRYEANHALNKHRITAEEWHDLFRALIEAESAYRPTAISPKGAYGLGQLMPATAHDLGVDPKSITQNLDGAARYLLTQLALFDSIDHALAAYNAGPHRVTEYGGVPPFRETRTYVARITRIRARLAASRPSFAVLKPDH